MNDWRHIVAIMLAAALLLFILTVGIENVWRAYLGQPFPEIEFAAEWGVVIGLLIGALAHYINGSGGK